MTERASSRIRLLSILILAFALALCAKLYFLQIVHGSSFADKADRQYVQPVASLFDRGTIYFKTKSGDLLSAATLKNGFTLSINPKLLENSEEAYGKINAIYPIDHADFIAKAGKKDDPYEELGKRLPQDKADAIVALKITGVSLAKESWRFYPAGDLASHALGFVGYKGDALVGRYGLEKYYDDLLSRSGESVHVNFFAEIFSDISKTLFETEGNEGSVVTTLEPTVQDELQKQLELFNQDWHPEVAGGIVIDPNDGSIYAMALTPTFDPNSYGKEKDPAVFTNRLVESRYEMGSIIKPLTMAAGIDSGTITANSTYDDKGCIELNTKKICNFDGKPRGVVPMQEILNQSLNLGASFIALKMGNEKFSQYMQAYGFSEETGIDVPGEIHGDISNLLESTRNVEHATASYGQGIALTPIETARALSALANGGYLVNPHLATRIDYKLGYSKDLSFGDKKQILQTKTTDEVTRMLVEVVDKALRHGAVKNEHFSVAAKTGTAQIANPAGGGYYADRYLHSFFGYFPAYKPRFLVFLYAVNPKGANYASETLTDPFINLTKFLINYYSLSPDR